MRHLKRRERRRETGRAKIDQEEGPDRRKKDNKLNNEMSRAVSKYLSEWSPRPGAREFVRVQGRCACVCACESRLFR